MTFASLLNGVWLITAFAVAMLGCDLIVRRAASAWRAAFWTLGILVASALPWLPTASARHAAMRAPIVIQSDAVSLGSSTATIQWTGVVIGALAAWRLLHIFAGLVALRRLRDRASNVGELDILVSSRVAGPVTFGVLRPVVLVPDHFWNSAPSSVRDSVIEHERAHIERRDYAWNLAVELATAVFWWHPAIAWMKRRLARMREFACDERAASRTPGYARSIVEAAQIIVERRVPQGALGFFDSTNLEERMMKLQHPIPRFPFRMTVVSFIGACVVLTVVASGLLFSPVARAQAQDQKIYKIEGNVKAPQLVKKVEPEYTEEARDSKISGTTVLSVVISAEGVIEQVEVTRQLDPGLDANAVSAVQDWKFRPATKDGQPVRVSATIEVNFRLE